MELTLKDLRIKKKMTIMAAAVGASMSIDGYRKIEIGEYSSHRSKTIENLAKAFGVSEQDIKVAIGNTKTKTATRFNEEARM